MANEAHQGGLGGAAGGGDPGARGRATGVAPAGREDEERGEPQAPVDPGELLAAAEDFARANPHAAIAGALALGFVLGGGLTPRLLGSLAVLAGRRYLAESAREALEGAVRRQIDEVVGA